MAAGSMSPPGTEWGPCAEACEHRDCAATRARAAALCPHCGKAIGYDTMFYLDDNKNPEHMVCAHRAAGV